MTRIEGMRREYSADGVKLGYGLRFASQAQAERILLRRIATATLGRVRVRAGETVEGTGRGL
jgi:hypothetical protein